MYSHWIKGNEMSQSPNRMIYLQIMGQAGRLAGSQTFRCAATRETRQYEKSKEPAPVKSIAHTDRVMLWQYISDFTRKRERTVLVAYNLAEQLRLGMALEILPELGWKLRRFSLRDETAVVSMERDRATLIMVDAKSWLPMSLEKIAELVDVQLPVRPAGQGPALLNISYAHQACLVLDNSIGALKDWIKDNEMGNWRPTGAGMAWANWRHSHYTHRVLAGGDADIQTLEAQSVGAGRAEAWRWGIQEEGPFIEWDLPLAYSRVALDASLPTAYFAESSSRNLDRHLDHSEKRRTLIKARVHQDLPTLGVKHENRWVWPVGDITGWWWDDELAMARDYGADITIERALTYRAAPALKQWATWAIDFIESDYSPGTPIQRAAVKHWSRSLIGRFGLRYENWQKEDVPVEPGIYTAIVADDIDNVTRQLMVVGNQTWLSNERKYGSEAVPSIMAAVMAECRVRLWSLMIVAGLSHVLYVDTDALIVDEVGSAHLASYVASGGGWGLRQKHVYESLEILGVRQLITDSSRKLAGIPRSAVRTGPRSFHGAVTEGLATSLSFQRSDVVYAPLRDFNVSDLDHRRQHLPDGYTRAYVL